MPSSIVRTLSGRIRRRGASALAALCAAALGMAAVQHQGIAQQDLDLHDNGVWVTSTSKHLVARINASSHEADGVIRTTSSDFDVSQNGENVLVSNVSGKSVDKVDPAQVSSASVGTLPAGTTIAQGADRVIAINSTAGTVSGALASQAGLVTSGSASHIISDSPGLLATIGTDGTIHALSPSTGSLTTATATATSWAAPTSTTLTLSDGADAALTAVGSKPIVLERGTGILHLPGGGTIDLGETGLTLQQPGPDASSVLVASRTELISVPLDGSSPTRTPSAAKGDAAPGVAARPVRLGNCSYAAWSSSGQFLRMCGSSSPEYIHDNALASSTTPTFRTNRDAIVLNDTTIGTVWLPDRNLAQADEWTENSGHSSDDATPDENAKDTTQDPAQTPNRDEEHPPDAVDDSFGVRAGRTTILPVLANDSDPDGDVLTAVPGDVGSTATVTQVQGGLALAIKVPPDATGTLTVPYTANDGRGMSDSAVATVTIRPDSENSAPEQQATQTLKLAEGGTDSLSVLSNWRDPDGDDLHLVSATGVGLETRITPEGLLTVTELNGGTGPRELTLVVSDGRTTTEGKLTVDVVPAADAAPATHADHARGVVGQPVSISPLANDSSPTSTPLRLGSISEAPPGTTVTKDQAAGTVNFTAQKAGTYYLDYEASDGTSLAKGLIRVDIAEASEPSAAPIVEDDTVFLAPGGSVTVNPLANDSDPAGGVLVAVSATTPPGSGVSATVIDHSLVRISAVGEVQGKITAEYTVSNGTSTATGKITIVPLSDSTSQAPVAVNDTAVVRVGDIVTVPVLENDSSPSGLSLKTTGKLTVPDDSLGTAWINQDKLRFKAGQTPGTTEVSYTVEDSAGQTATATVTIEVRERDDAANAAPEPRPVTAATIAGKKALLTVPLDQIDPDGDSATLTGLATQPTKGSVEIKGDMLVYTAFEGSSGTDSFTYTVTDHLGATATGTARVGIAAPTAVNTPPKTTDDLVTAKPGRKVRVDVTANDWDSDDDPVTLAGEPTSEDPALTAKAVNGQVALDLPEKEGNYTVHYTATDSRGGTALGTLTAQVRADAPPQAPIAADDAVTLSDIDASGTALVDVLKNDSDPDGSPETLKVSSSDPNATVEGNSLRVAVTDHAQFILYTVTDPDGLTGQAVVFVPAASALVPQLNRSTTPVRIPADATTSVPLASHILTRAGTSPIIGDKSSISAGAGLSSVSAEGNGSLSVTPSPGFTGQTSVTLTVTDGTGDDALSTTLNLPILVEPKENRPPRFTPTALTVAPNENPVSVDLATMASDPDGDSLTYTIGPAPAGFTASLSGSTLTVGADATTATGTTGSLLVTVSDSKNPEVSASLPLAVSASTRPRITTTPARQTSHGEPVTVDVSGYVSNPFPGQGITLSGSPTITSGQGSVTASGTSLTITPAAGATGDIVARYQVLDATGAADRAATGTVTVTVASAPSAPTRVIAEPRDFSSARVTWAPGSANGSPITSYTLTEVGGAGSWSCTGSPCYATGLTSGRSYAFEVTATNANGTSSAGRSNTVTLGPSAPGAPTGVRLQAGEGTLTASWTPGAAVPGTQTTYRVVFHSDSGDITRTTTGTSLTIGAADGVKAGSSYSVTVTAIASSGGAEVGSSKSASSGSSATPYGKPGPFEITHVVQTGSGVTVYWQPANSNHAGPVSYTVSVTGPESRTVNAGSALSTPISLSTAGTYTFRVRATTKAGSTDSLNTKGINLTLNPLPPTGLSASASSDVPNQISASATPQAGNGWSASDLKVEYRVNGGRWQSKKTFDGLAAGRVTVEARAYGMQDGGEVYSESVSTSATVVGNPTDPDVRCDSLASDGTLTCSWYPSSHSGNPDDSHIKYSAYETGGSEARLGGGKEIKGLKQSHNPLTTTVPEGESRGWCVVATNTYGFSSRDCEYKTREKVAAQPRPAAPQPRALPINATSPYASCTVIDSANSGYSQDACWRALLDLSSFPAGSKVRCEFNDANVWPSKGPFDTQPNSTGTAQWLGYVLTNNPKLTASCHIVE
ncbi:Ig-like domain-containing protein [Actinomyces marmotae]|uniref:Tandem-95 repeat protein n=1 Tax=Actinomyces marmotae TaxID=2737173 RepID=A0A6M8B335_9ACTO|nr:Ig-like domain-containing protein [Actinomyces marmotae]QKD80322.1 tandem-95 repeat protein [Actinomyces marmotae]